MRRGSSFRPLPENEFPGLVLTLRGYAEHYDLDSSGAAQAAGGGLVDLDGSPSELIAKDGYIAVYERFNAAAAKLASSDPVRAVALLVRLWPCLKEPQKAAAARKSCWKSWPEWSTPLACSSAITVIMAELSTRSPAWAQNEGSRGSAASR